MQRHDCDVPLLCLRRCESLLAASHPRLVCRKVFFGQKQICELEGSGELEVDLADLSTSAASDRPPVRPASRRVELVPLDDDGDDDGPGPRLPASASDASSAQIFPPLWLLGVPRREGVAGRRAQSREIVTTTPRPRSRPRTTTRRPESEADRRRCGRGRPVEPQPSPYCNWIPIKDQRGCPISYRCEPSLSQNETVPETLNSWMIR